MKNAILECLVVTVVGFALSLAANAASSRGLSLSKDYFPRLPMADHPTPPASQASATKPSATQAATFSAAPAPDSEEAHFIALKKEGFNPIGHDAVVALFRDPLYQAEAYALVDARKDSEYTHGHIPGAIQLDHIHADQYLPTVLPLCQQALKVVVYCNGGDCEDSKFAAITLLEQGLDPTRIFVYPGGITEWAKDDLPVERGQRNSGDIVPGSQIGAMP